MQLKLHKNLSIDKWNSYSKTQRIIMMINELKRVSFDSRNVNASKESFERLLELVLLEKSLNNSHSYGKELFRFNEYISSLYLTNSFDKTTTMNLANVLLSFDKTAYNMLINDLNNF